MNERTIFGREVAIPLVDPYGPAVKARIPVPGLSAWPNRDLLGRHYYGLDQDETPENNKKASAVPGKIIAFNAEPVAVVNAGETEISGFSGFADSGLECKRNVGLGGLGLSLQGQNFLNRGIDWGSIIQSGIHAAPAIIQAAEGGGAPWDFYSGQNQAGAIQQQAPAGYTRNAQGQLIPLASAAQLAGGVGVGAAQIGNSLSKFVTQNPLLVLGAGVALVLLFTKPPSRR